MPELSLLDTFPPNTSVDEAFFDRQAGKNPIIFGPDRLSPSISNARLRPALMQNVLLRVRQKNDFANDHFVSLKFPL